jgi:hypothetical protein
VHLARLAVHVLPVVARGTVAVMILRAVDGMAMPESERRGTALTADLGTNGRRARIRQSDHGGLEGGEYENDKHEGCTEQTRSSQQCSESTSHRVVCGSAS